MRLLISVITLSVLVSASHAQVFCNHSESLTTCSNGQSAIRSGNTEFWNDGTTVTHFGERSRSTNPSGSKELGGAREGFAKGFANGVTIGNAWLMRREEKNLNALDQSTERLRGVNEKAERLIACQKTANAVGQSQDHCFKLFLSEFPSPPN